MNEHSRGLVLTFIAVLTLSPDALLVRLISVDTPTLLFWRGLLSGSMLYLLLLLYYRRRLFSMFRATGRIGILAAFVIASGNMFFVSSLRLTTAANTLVILASTPLIAALGTRIFLGEAVPRRTWIAILTAFAGIIILFSGSLGHHSTLGDLLAIGGACCWAGNIVIVRAARPRNMVPANALGNLTVAPLALLIGAAPLSVPPDDYGLLLILGLLVLPVSYGLITLAPRILSAAEVSLILLLET
ncbi:MAG: DMT family transporter, partial [Phycisphaeraceae bacterium]|nr:DMT family transporter [Phycisphaeraceae bacterium]